MQTGGLILLDLFLDLIILGDLLAVNHFLDPFTVLVLTRNLCCYSNFLVIVLFFDCKCDQFLGRLADFFCLCLSRHDLAVIDERCYLVTEKRLSLRRRSSELSVLCHDFPPSVLFGLTGLAVF